MKTDLALHKPTRSNSAPETAHFVTDGIAETSWCGTEFPKHLDVDLGANCALTEVEVVCPKDEDYIVFASADGVMFDRIGEGRNTQSVSVGGTYRIVRVLVTSVDEGECASPEITAVHVYGDVTDEPITETRRTLVFPSYDEWQRSHKAKTAEDELRSLVCRILGEKYADLVHFELTGGEDYYEISDCVTIKANNGVSAAAGFGYYLANYCKIRITEQTKEIRVPDVLPTVDGIVRKTTPHGIRFAFNYCTFGYTMPFFSREEWQRELDYLMLSGVNTVLDIGGYGALWVHFLESLGYTADDAKDYIAGYTYEPWWLMGNIEGYGGTVADAWLYDQLDMARERISYLTAMGATAVGQMFTGALPASFGRIATPYLTKHGFAEPTPYLAEQGVWNEGFVRPNVLSPEYPNYSFIAQAYYGSLRYIFGETSHVYCGDVCHEGGKIPDGMTKAGLARRLLDELLTYDRDAMWLLQGWMDNPMPDVLDGFGDDKAEHICVLGLTMLNRPDYADETKWRGREYGGTPWIFCDLNNFGGRTGMHGELRTMLGKMKEARLTSHHMKGIGIMPEANYQNPIVFALLFDSAWDENIDVDVWVENYLRCRYGNVGCHTKRAWDLLCRSVYDYASPDGTTRACVLASYPVITSDLLDGKLYRRTYNPADVIEAADEFTKAKDEIGDTDEYRYDLCDILRQSAIERADALYLDMARAIDESNADAFDRASAEFLTVIDEAEATARLNPDETVSRWLGRIDEWIADSRNGDYSDYDEYMMKFTARAILTSWASRPINFYAIRLWDGLISGYIKPMWQEVITNVSRQLHTGEPLMQALGRAGSFRHGWAFAVKE